MLTLDFLLVFYSIILPVSFACLFYTNTKDGYCRMMTDDLSKSKSSVVVCTIKNPQANIHSIFCMNSNIGKITLKFSSTKDFKTLIDKNSFSLSKILLTFRGVNQNRTLHLDFETWKQDERFQLKINKALLEKLLNKDYGVDTIEFSFKTPRLTQTEINADDDIHEVEEDFLLSLVANDLRLHQCSVKLVNGPGATHTLQRSGTYTGIIDVPDRGKESFVKYHHHHHLCFIFRSSMDVAVLGHIEPEKRGLKSVLSCSSDRKRFCFLQTISRTLTK